MASLARQLIRTRDGLALLFTPPFDQPLRDPGYISAYPPGMRENGGQYSHAAMWAVLAFSRLGDARQAVDLFAMLNPINHARDRAAVERYKVEPYVVAADIYAEAPHCGRGGWTWYTGAAGWMYRAGVEGILGISREGAFLLINPCIPADWLGFEVTLALASTHYTIQVSQSTDAGQKQSEAHLDGEPVLTDAHGVRIPLDSGRHVLRLNLVPRSFVPGHAEP